MLKQFLIGAALLADLSHSGPAAAKTPPATQPPADVRDVRARNQQRAEHRCAAARATGTPAFSRAWVEALALAAGLL